MSYFLVDLALEIQAMIACISLEKESCENPFLIKRCTQFGLFILTKASISNVTREWDDTIKPSNIYQRKLFKKSKYKTSIISFF